MKFCLTMLALAAFVIPMATSTAWAEVTDWRLSKLRVYEQTASNTQPTQNPTTVFQADVRTENLNDLTSLSLGGAPGSPVSLNGPFGNGSSYRWRIDQDFADEAAMNAAYPNNASYTLDAQGPQGPTSESIAFSGTFPVEIPYFTGQVYQNLQGMNPSQDLTLTWDTLPSGVDAFVFIDDDSAGVEVFDEEVTGLTSTVIPGNTLSPNVEHIALIAYFAETSDARNGFTTGQGSTEFITLTELFFTTGTAIPEPSSMLLGLLATLGCVTGRRRS